MQEGLQFLRDLHIHPERKEIFIKILEEKFNQSLDLLERAATQESLRDCLLSIGLETVNFINNTHRARPEQVAAMNKFVELVLNSNSSRESRILLFKTVNKYILKRT